MKEIPKNYVAKFLQTSKENNQKKRPLTSGPDLPVNPIGPEDPLIASCRTETQARTRLHSTS